MGYLANIGDNFSDNLGHDRGRDVRGQEGSRRHPGSGFLAGAVINPDGGFARH